VGGAEGVVVGGAEGVVVGGAGPGVGRNYARHGAGLQKCRRDFNLQNSHRVMEDIDPQAPMSRPHNSSHSSTLPSSSAGRGTYVSTGGVQLLPPES